MVAEQGKISLTKRHLQNAAVNEVADVLLARMDAKLVLHCFEDVLASVPAAFRASESNGLIKAYVAALFANATYDFSQREQQDLLRRIFICRKTKQL